MSKKLLDVLPSLQSFKDSVISPLKNMFNGAEWLNDTTSYTKQETIYRLLIFKYGDRIIRYDNETIFLNRLIFDLADLLPDIYAKQQVFIKNKLNEFLSDNKNRAVIIDNETTNTRNSDSKSKLGNSSSPLNLVINDASEIINAPITSSNLSNIRLLENYNGNNQQVNYNFVNDLIKTLNADYSLRLNEFMELLGGHFVNIVGSFYKYRCDNQTVKDEPYRFNNGYVVNEVDYLGAQNKQEINRFNEKLERLNTKIQTKQDQITAGNNITITGNNVINAVVPKVDLSNYYTKQEVDNQNKIQDNRIDIAIFGVDTNAKQIELLIQQDLKLDGEVKTLKNDLGDLGDQVVDVNNKFNDYTPLNAFNEFQTTTNTKQQDQDRLIQNNHNDINELMGRVETTTQDINDYVKYSVIKRDRNWELQHFNNTGKTLDGKPIYEGVIEFEASSEANLVNNCLILLGGYLYNITDNRFIDVSTVSLRVHNNYQIRGSFPSTAKNYRLYFVGVVRDVKGV